MIKPYYQDSKVTILNGHVITELRSLPDESVHCCVLSPPYWGLRDYGLEPQVWDDPGGCEHEWHIKQHNDTRGIEGSNLVGRNPYTQGEARLNYQEGFCQKCQAWLGSLGLEPTPELYIQHLVQVFREIWRVLRKDGTLWLNLGDSYWGGKGQSGHGNPEYQQERFDKGISFNVPASHVAGQGKTRPQDGKHPTLKPKDLCMIPARVALALQADGWWLRRDIIWNKPNPMPESVNGWRWERHRVKVGHGKATEYKPAGWDTREASHDKIDGNYQDRQHEAKYEDCPGCPKCNPNDGLVLCKGAWRPTSSHEYVFLLTKSDTYFCDAEAVREPPQRTAAVNWKDRDIKKYGDKMDKRFEEQGTYKDWNKYKTTGIVTTRNLRSVWTIEDDSLANWFQWYANQPEAQILYERYAEQMQNKSDVWTIATQPFPGAHFATFPEKLASICIRAGSSEKGCCPECGAPWVRVVEKKDPERRLVESEYPGEQTIATKKYKHDESGPESKTIGWRPSCEHTDLKPMPCTVCDPFSGSGQAGIVAKKLGRKAILIELKPEYCEMPLDKLRQENIY